MALELATRHPDRVNSLVLLCPAYRGCHRARQPRPSTRRRTGCWKRGTWAGAVRLNVNTWLGPEAANEVRDQLTAMHRRAFEVQLAAARQDPPPAKRDVGVDPAKVAVPTVIVTGGLDLDHFQTVAELLTAEIKGAELVRLPWAAHLPSMERPDAVVTLLLDVLRHDPTVHAP